MSQIREVVRYNLKYRPYLFKNIFSKTSKTTDETYSSFEQIQSAKFLCQQVIKVSDNDKYWNMGYAAGGAIIAGVLTFMSGGLGIGLVPLLISGSLATAEGAIIYQREEGDAIHLMNGTSIAVINGEKKFDAYLIDEASANDHYSEAYMAAGMVVIAPVSHVLKPIVKVAKNASQTKVNKVRNTIKEKSQKKARDRYYAKNEIEKDLEEEAQTLLIKINKLDKADGKDSALINELKDKREVLLKEIENIDQKESPFMKKKIKTYLKDGPSKDQIQSQAAREEKINKEIDASIQNSKAITKALQDGQDKLGNLK